MVMRTNGVFEGGGVKAIGFVGAVCRMEEQGYKWNKLAGTSAGSIIASLLSAGYNGKELKDILYSLNFMDFTDNKNIKNMPYVNLLMRLMLNKGIFNGNAVEKFVEEALQKKGKIKFKDVSKNGESMLKIIASDTTQNEMLILPDDLKKYKIDPMEFPISKAVRMSIGIPFFFVPYILDSGNNSNYIVDGGITSNYPIWLFDTDNSPKLPTFGFKFLEPKSSGSLGVKRNLISYALDIVNTTLNNHEERFIKNPNMIRTINIPALEVQATDFDIDISKKKLLFNEGYKAAESFLNNWDFDRYVETFGK
jgi:NTE family protein